MYTWHMNSIQNSKFQLDLPCISANYRTLFSSMLDKKTHYIIFHDMCSFGQTGTQKADPVIGGEKGGRSMEMIQKLYYIISKNQYVHHSIANIVIYYSLIFQDFLKMVFRWKCTNNRHDVGVPTPRFNCILDLPMHTNGEGIANVMMCTNIHMSSWLTWTISGPLFS